MRLLAGVTVAAEGDVVEAHAGCRKPEQLVWIGQIADSVRLAVSRARWAYSTYRPILRAKTAASGLAEAPMILTAELPRPLGHVPISEQIGELAEIGVVSRRELRGLLTVEMAEAGWRDFDAVSDIQPSVNSASLRAATSVLPTLPSPSSRSLASYSATASSRLRR